MSEPRGKDSGQETRHTSLKLSILFILLVAGILGAGFFYHHTMFSQKLGDDAGRNAGFCKLAVQVHAWRDDGRLDGVEHVESRRHLAKAVPVDTAFVGT